MRTSKTKLTYYNSVMWKTVVLPEGTRAVRPYRLDGRPMGATTRYYRRPR